jgi:hypothetical protein
LPDPVALDAPGKEAPISITRVVSIDSLQEKVRPRRRLPFMANLLLGCTGILVRDPVTPASEAWANLSTVPSMSQVEFGRAIE